MVHSLGDGMFDEVMISERAESKIIEKNIWTIPGTLGQSRAYRAKRIKQIEFQGRPVGPEWIQNG